MGEEGREGAVRYGAVEVGRLCSGRCAGMMLATVDASAKVPAGGVRGRVSYRSREVGIPGCGERVVGRRTTTRNEIKPCC